ncbi:hypothetical protein MMC17_010145 [Xylographa soralifera]|nr:hypothetical protein [Xylographa soralifera]
MASQTQLSSAQPNPAQSSPARLSSPRISLQPVDLWQRALATLDDDLKASLDFKNSTKRDFLEKTLKTVEEKRQLCLRKRWKFKRNGKEVVVRDILEKIIRWLDHFKAIGDVAAQYEPAHAALPWAGVAVSDTQVSSTAVSGLETVAHLITRYAIFEHVHIQRNTAASAELEPLVTGLYAELLTFLARAKKYFQTPTAVRMLNSALITFQTDADQHLQRIASQDAKVSAIATLSDAETLNRLRDLEQPIHRITDQIATYAKYLEDTRYREILDWLSPIRFIEHQKRHSGRRLQGSGEWLLNHREYLDWQSSNTSSIFLLHVFQPGVSCMSGILYCSKNASEVELSDPEEIMRSIVRQLGVISGAQKTIHSAIVNEYERREAEAKTEGFDVTRLRPQDCNKLILNITGSNPAIIALDAIDEVQRKSRYELVNALQQIIRDSSNVVKIFVTSRDDDQVLSLFTDAAVLRINAENNRADIERSVHDQVALAISDRRLLGGDVTSKLQANLSQALINGVGEIFQLVIWQIEKLCDMRHEFDIREAMQRFSEDTLDRLYSEVFDSIRRVEAYSSKIAIRAFSLLLCLHEPLSPASFLAALTLVDGKQAAVLQLSPPVGLEAGLSPIEHFYHYGVLYWAEHCKATFMAGNDPELLKLAKEFMFDDEGISLSFIGWLEDAQEYAKVLPRHHLLKREFSASGCQDHTPLFTLCVFGLDDLLNEMSQATTCDWNRKNDSGQTGLYLACSSGQQSIVRVSLGNGADVNLSSGRHGTPLQAACFEGYIDIVQLLIENAIEGNYEDVAILLLKTALRSMIRANTTKSSKGLRKPGSAKCKAIQAAISKRQVRVLERFIERIQDPRIELLVDSIATVASGSRDSIITLLLDQGLDIEHEGQFGSPLRPASLLGHESTVQLLLDLGAKVSASSPIGNALEAAARNGHVSIANSLLQEGINTNITGGSYGIALQAAAYRGYSKVAELLLNASADVYLPGIIKDAFHAAAKGGHENVIRLFLDRGFIFHEPLKPPALCLSRWSIYKNLLYSSSPFSKIENSWHEFRRKQRVNDFSWKKNYALKEAASNGHLRIVQLILDNLAEDGARISTEDIGKSLHKASENGHREVVKCFLHRKMDVAPYLENALNSAARNGHLGVVDTLATYERLSLPVNDQIAKHMTEYCIEVEKNILIPGCFGDHVPIIKRALDLINQRYSTAELKHIHKIILHESFRYNSGKVIDLAFRIAQFDNSDLLKAITLSCEYGSDKTLRYLLLMYPHDSPRSGVCGRGCFSTRDENTLLETLDYGLYIAALNGHAKVVKTLIQEGAYIDVAFEVIPQDSVKEAPDDTPLTEDRRDRIYQTALQAAFSGFTPRHKYDFISAEEEAGREAVILLLLEHGANANESIKDSDDMLSVAIEHCSDKVVQSMIDKGASLMNSRSGRMLAFRTAAGRALEAAAVMKVLLKAGGCLEENGSFKHPENSNLNSILDSALRFFDKRKINRHFSEDGRFCESKSVRDVLYTGPGAVVKMLLQLLPMEKLKDDRYGLLLQMAVSIDDRVWTSFLVERGVNVNTQGYYYGTALQCAACFGNLELLQLLLRSGAEVNILKGEYSTALRAAVRGGHEKVVDVLLQHGADVSLCSSKPGYWPPNSRPIMRLALESPNLAILKSLIAAGADLNVELSDQPPLLITTCGLGNLAIVRLFLDNKVNINRPKKRPWNEYQYDDIHCVSDSMASLNSFDRYDSRYRDEWASALHMACSTGHDDIARVLLEHDADVQLEVEMTDGKGYSSKTPLQTAAYTGHLSVVRLLINAGATINHFNSHGTALSIASRKNRLEIVKELLLVGATICDPSGRWNALTEACRSRSHAVVELLLDELPEILEERACANALCAAASRKDDRVFQMLLAQNVPVFLSTLSQACAASLQGSTSVLLQRGVDIDGDDSERGRALQVASYHQTETTVDLLLNHGANVNTLTPKYGNPLQAALEGLTSSFLGAPPEFSTFETKHDQTEYNVFIFNALLARGANTNTASRSLGNPLHLAAFIGHVPIVEQLLNKGADINSVSNRFDTALLAALEHENLDVVNLLLHAGIDVNHVSSKHGTALHYACDRQNVRMVRLLLDYGADPDRICGSHGSPLTASIAAQISWHDGRDRGKDVAELILGCGNYFRIAEQDLLVAVKRIARSDGFGEDLAKLSYGEELVRLFLEYDPNLLATESILIAAVEHLGSSGTDTLRLLLQRDGGAGVKEAMVDAVKNLEIMKVLLKHRPICPITPEVIFNLCTNYRSSSALSSFASYSNVCELISLLLDHEKDMPITPTVLSTVLGTDVDRFLRPPRSSSQQTQNLVEYLFARNSELAVTESTVMEARSAKVMRVLLKHAPNRKVTPEMLIAAAGGTELRADANERELVLLLLAHDETATVPQSLANIVPPRRGWDRGFPGSVHGPMLMHTFYT